MLGLKLNLYLRVIYDSHDGGVDKTMESIASLLPRHYPADLDVPPLTLLEVLLRQGHIFKNFKVIP